MKTTTKAVIAGASLIVVLAAVAIVMNIKSRMESAQVDAMIAGRVLAGVASDIMTTAPGSAPQVLAVWPSKTGGWSCATFQEAGESAPKRYFGSHGYAENRIWRVEGQPSWSEPVWNDNCRGLEDRPLYTREQALSYRGPS